MIEPEAAKSSVSSTKKILDFTKNNVRIWVSAIITKNKNRILKYDYNLIFHFICKVALCAAFT